MSQDHSLTIFVALAAVAILMQGAAMIGIWLAIQKVNRQVEGIRADVKQRLDPLTQSAAAILADSREPLRTITANLAETSRLLRERAGTVDALVADMVDKSRLQALRVDQMVSDLMQRVETTADVVQRNVLVPIHELSAVMKGVRAGLEFLFSRRRVSNVTQAAADDQLFI
jgi:hypothetical protein